LTGVIGKAASGISPDEFVLHYPKLFHMAEPGSWPSIERYGLLSTDSLLNLIGLAEPVRSEIRSQHRPTSRSFELAGAEKITFRDQIPMRPSALRKCLVGMTEKEWYELLNARVFFWVTLARVLTLSKARAYRKKTHCVLTIETRLLLDRYLDKISLSPINSGSTIYNPQKRGEKTFLPLDQYPYSLRRKLRGKANAIAELTVMGGVPDIREFTTEVHDLRNGKTIRKVFP
jgi:hypothetical protein